MLNIVMLVMTLILLGATVWLAWRLRTIESQFGHFFKNPDEASLMTSLNTFARRVEEQAEGLEKQDAELKRLKVVAEKSHTRVGFVRFNPFSDTGGDQSFCLAVMDAHGSGWVLSSIHARTGTRVYAKQLQHGESSHNLSEEESTAVTKALKLNPYQVHGQ